MNNALKLAIAAAAVVVVALVGINLMPRSGVIGGPGAEPDAESVADPVADAGPSPSPAVEPQLHRRLCAPGRPMLQPVLHRPRADDSIPARRYPAGTFTSSTGGRPTRMSSRRYAPASLARRHVDLYVTPLVETSTPVAATGTGRARSDPSDRRSMTSRPRWSRRPGRCLARQTSVTVGGLPWQEGRTVDPGRSRRHVARAIPTAMRRSSVGSGHDRAVPDGMAASRIRTATGSTDTVLHRRCQRHAHR